MSYHVPRTVRPLPALLSLALAGLAWPAFASLGGDAGSISADSAQLGGQHAGVSMLHYERHDLTMGTGSVVHEYLSPAGKVFAVTWRGPLPPNLRQLFGNYFESFRTAAATQSRPGGHRQLTIAQPDLVVQASGHLRAFLGKAYVPSLVPPDVSVADLP
ncbi:MAG TPA: DUF2844 domain-containing protein [Steroidobacteraceae bacterium]